MREKKRGFTLIELLAVIVVLAIVSLIATPIVLSIIETSKKGAFKRSAEGVLRASDIYYANKQLEIGTFENIEFECDNNECISDTKDGNGNPLKLNVSGEMGEGYIEITNEGDIEFSLSKYKYCAVKYKDENQIEITEEKCENIDMTRDVTPPIIESVNTSVTTNSLEIVVSAKDNESGIYGYAYSIDNGVTYTNIQRSNIYTYEGLKNDKEYEVRVKVYNGTYGKDTYSEDRSVTESEVKKVTLSALDIPEITFSPEEWSLEKEVTIDYKGLQIKEYSIDNEQTYVEYINPFKVTENISITAKASDGNNVKTISKTISKIDRELPTVEVSDINTSYETKDEITLTLNDNLSGVTHYCVTSESISDNCNWISGNGSVKYTVNTNGTYYAYSKDLVGNISEGKEFVIDKIDTESPSASLELESKTTNSITVKAVCTDNVGITKYEYSYDNGVTYETGENETYTFSNLTTGTYNMKVRCFDEAGNSAVGNVTDTTNNLPIPTYTVSNSGVWSTSKTVTISYNDTENIHQYTIERGTATKEDGTVLTVGEVYPTSNEKETVIFTSNGSITAIISDGTNTVTATSQLVSDIETVKPTDMTLSANSDTTYAKTKSVTVTLKDTGGSGLAAGSIKYGWSTSNTTAPSSYTPVSTSATSGTNTTTFVASGSGLSGSYYLWVVPVTYKDNAGNSNTTTVKSTGTFKFDNVGPTVSASVPTTWTNSNKTITVSATDSHVGSIGGYYIGTNTTAPTSSSTWQTGNTFSKGAGTYYIWAKDSLENISSSYATVTVNNIETTAPTISLSVTSGTTYAKSRASTVTLQDTGGSGLAAGTYTIKYGWGTSAVACTSMTKSIDIPVTSGASRATGTITISSGSGAGSIYICNSAAIKDVAGNSLAASTTKSASMYLDNTAPTSVTLSANSDTTYAKTKSVTVTLKDTGGSGLAAGSIKYGWSASTSTSPSSYTTVNTSATSGTNTTTFVASGSGLSGSYYLWVVPVTYKDNVGNSNTTTVKSTGTFKFDNTAPTSVTLSANSDTTYAKTKSVTVTLKDTGGSGLAAGSIKYGWSTSTSTAPSSYTTVSTSATSGTNTTTFTASGSGLSGSYYLWVVPVTYKDNAGNSNTTTVKSTGTFKFDNTVPTLTLGTVSTTKDTITVPYTASDSHSGINTTTCVYGTSTSYGSTGTISGSNCVMSGLNSSTTYYYKVTTTDKAGNSTYKTGSATTEAAIDCNTANNECATGCTPGCKEKAEQCYRYSEPGASQCYSQTYKGCSCDCIEECLKGKGCSFPETSQCI